jgi:hypothetical protein
MVRYLEDFEPGHKFASGRLSVEAARIKSFAAEFDPQPFHLERGPRPRLVLQGTGCEWLACQILLSVSLIFTASPQKVPMRRNK